MSAVSSPCSSATIAAAVAATPSSPAPFQVTFVLGGPGSGKGTQCGRLVEALGLVHISAGDCLRNAMTSPEQKDTEIGLMIASYIKNGQIVPVDVTIRLLREVMEAERNRSGKTRFLIDGFPRNVENVNGWIRVMGPIYPPNVTNLAIVNMVLYLDCPESTMLERVLERGKTSGRSDDNVESLRKRFATFLTETMPVVDMVRAMAPSLVHTINSARPLDQVFESTRALLTPLVTDLVAADGLVGKPFGVDSLYTNPNLLRDTGRIGIVTNQACFSSRMEPSADVIFGAAHATSNARVTCVFGPQHGFHQTEQDNMIETPDTEYIYESHTDNKETKAIIQKVPLFSLYSATRMPTDEQIALIDTFVVDLQDIGCRVYTFQYTLAFCLRAAATHNKRVIVLDRPNPLGLCCSPTVSHIAPASPSAFPRKASASPVSSISPPPTKWHRVSGNVMTDDTKGASFVGLYDLPMQYGLTLGELGHLFIERDRAVIHKPVNYTVVPVPGLCRQLPVSSIQRDWYGEHVYAFLPSPNMPSAGTTDAFIATVMLEATNISEGRGTTRPFNIIGAPWMSANAFITFFDSMASRFADASYANLKGIRLVPYRFRPTFNKHQSKICNGMFIHIDASLQPNMFVFGILLILHTVITCCADFAWRDPKLGYEYNFTDPAINLILGSSKWKSIFDTAQSAARTLHNESRATPDAIHALLESNVATVTSLLQRAHEEACEFAKASRPFWLYF